MNARQSGLAMLVLACLAPGTAAATALGVSATAGDVGIVRDSIYNPVRPADAIEPGVRLQTARPGRVELQLEPVGRFALGDDSRVLLHSIEAVDPPARMHLVRLVHEAGTLRASSRTAGTTPADLRINLGAVRMRVFGAEVWMERASAFDEVCLVAGAVEMQTPAGPQRLDEPGACLRVTAGGLQHLDAAAAGPLAPRLLRTTADTRLAAAAAAAASTVATVTPAPQPPPPPPPVPERPAPEPSAEPAPAPPAGAGPWTIVLASLPERDRADSEAARLRGLGLDATVIAAARDDGTTTWRVVSGSYPQKADAAADIAAIRKRRGLSGAWVTQLP